MKKRRNKKEQEQSVSRFQIWILRLTADEESLNLFHIRGITHVTPKLIFDLVASPEFYSYLSAISAAI